MVDVQNDFCPGGSLAVPDGDAVVAPLNHMVDFARKNGWSIFASRDWHPAITTHFAQYGGKWPVHCVQNTHGAEFHPNLDVKDATILSKGMYDGQDGYSAMWGACLIKQDALVNIVESKTTFYIGGLATDYCVKATALDAKYLGFNVVFLADACRAVNINPGDGTSALQEMKSAGVVITMTDEVINDKT